MAALTKVLVTGASGQVGFELARQLGPERVISKPREALDITDREHINSWLPTLKPDVVVNCAAYTDVEAAQKDPARCWSVNTRAVHNLIDVCNKQSIPFIHISSAYVFGQDYDRTVPYSEDDVAGPLGIYGHSKCAAEHAILGSTRGCSAEGGWFDCGGWWVLRAPALYEQPWRPYQNLPQLWLSMSDNRRGQPLAVAADVVTTPTYVPHFVQAILHIIDHLDTFPWGVYHVSNRGATSWFEFARKLMASCRQQCRVVPTDRQNYHQRLGSDYALHPSYTVLNPDKFVQVSGLVLPTWEEGLEQFCRQFHRQA